MKTTVRLTFILTALALSFAACEKNSPTIANDGNGNGGGVVDIQKERVIIYSVGNNENRRTLETDGEWDALLEQLCDQALGGSEVTFYNLSQTTYLNGNNYRWGHVIKKNNGISWKAGDAYGVEIGKLDLPKGYLYGSKEANSTKIDPAGALVFRPSDLASSDAYEMSLSETITISAVRGQNARKIGTITSSDLKDDAE